jgi:hypothetical protein
MDWRSKTESPAQDVFGLFIFSVYKKSGFYRLKVFCVCAARIPHLRQCRPAEGRREPGLHPVH